MSLNRGWRVGRIVRRSAPRKFMLAALVAGAALAAAASASAASCTGPTCVPLSFNWAVLDTPGVPNQVVVSPSGTPISATANVTPTSLTTATYTVDPSDFHFPQYSFTKPAAGTINVTLKNTATGTLNFATGAVTMTADMLANITLTGVGNCLVDTGSQTLSTANTQPLLGVPFPPGPTGAATGNGALGVAWSSLPAGTGPACVILNAAIGGPGGLWLSRNISPPSLGITFGKLKTVTAGHSAVVRATISNSGGDATGPVKACLKAPKPLKPTSSCHTISNIAGGASAAVSFKIKTAKNKHGKYKLTLTVSGDSVSSAKKKTTLKVRAASVHKHHSTKPSFTG